MKISIVCTDRGRHRLWRIGFILEVLERSPVGAGTEVVRDAAGARTGYRLTCRRCGRSPYQRVDTWRQLVDGLDRLHAARLDISQLPY